jgi:hypothetical protein
MDYQKGDIVKFTRGWRGEQKEPLLGVIVEIYPDKASVRVWWLEHEFIGVCFRGDLSPVKIDEE